MLDKSFSIFGVVERRTKALHVPELPTQEYNTPIVNPDTLEVDIDTREEVLNPNPFAEHSSMTAGLGASANFQAHPVWLAHQVGLNVALGKAAQYIPGTRFSVGADSGICTGAMFFCVNGSYAYEYVKSKLPMIGPDGAHLHNIRVGASFDFVKLGELISERPGKPHMRSRHKSVRIINQETVKEDGKVRPSFY